MKKFLIGLVIEAVFDALVKALGKFVHRSSSKIDNKVLNVIKDERNQIVKELLAQV